MSAWIDWLNGFSQAWADAMVKAAWQGGLAVGVVWLISRYAQRLPARIKSWLWRLAYLKLLVGLVWVAPVELAILSPPPALIDNGTQPAHQAAVDSISPRDIEMFAVTIPDASHEPDPVGAPRQRTLLDPSAYFFGLWLAAFAGSMVLLGRGWFLARRLRRSGEPIDDAELLTCAAGIARKMGLGSAPRLAWVDGIPSPLLVGVLRPTVLFPAAILTGAHPADLRLVLAHELAHLRRRDLVWNWLPALVNRLFFFHPLVWLARREYRLTQELACDALALGATGVRPSEYGAMVLAAVASAAGVSRQRILPQPSHALAVGVVSSSSARTLERRLLAMRHSPTWSPRRLVVTGAALTLVAAVALVPWRIVAQEQPAAESRERDREVGREGEGDAASGTKRTVATEEAAAGEKAKPGRNARIFSLQHARASETAVQLGGLLSGEDKASGVKISGDDRTNQLVVLAPAETMAQIEEILKKLDIAEPGAGPGAERPARRGGGGGLFGGDGGAPVQPAHAFMAHGRIVADTVTLRAPSDSTVQAVKMREGDRVKKGDVIVELDDRRARLALVRAETKVQGAQTQLGRVRKMNEQKAVSDFELMQAENDLRTNMVELELLRQELDEFKITAPISGVVSRSEIREGVAVRKGDALASIVEVDVLKLEFQANVAHLGKLKVGGKVRIQPEPGAQEHEAEVYYISPEVDAASSTFRAKAKVSGPGGTLRSGMAVTVRVQYDGPAEKPARGAGGAQAH